MQNKEKTKINYPKKHITVNISLKIIKNNIKVF